MRQIARDVECRAALRMQLGEQRIGQHESGDHEEQIDAVRAFQHPVQERPLVQVQVVRRHVGEEHGKDGDGAEPVDVMDAPAQWARGRGHAR